MKLNLEQLSNIILSNLNKTKLDLEVLNNIIKYIEKTDISYMSVVFNGVVEFIKNHNEYPTPDYLLSNYKEFYSYVKNEYNDDLLKDFLFIIKRDYNLTSITEAVNKKDIDKIFGVLDNIELSSDLPEPYDPSKVMEDSIERSKFLKEVMTGVPELDDCIQGFQRKAIHTIAAAPGGCKTTFAINIAYNAIRNKKKVLFLSLEISSFSIYAALFARHSKEINLPIEQYKIKKGLLDKEGLRRLELVKNDFIEKYKDYFILRETEHIGGFSRFLIEKLIKKLKKQGTEVDLIVLDYINLMKYEDDNPVNNKAEKFDVINKYINYFKKLSVKCNIVTILLMQVNRNAIEILAKGKSIDMSKLAEANEAERCSDTITLLSSYADLLLQNKIKIELLKNRDGALPTEPIYTYTDLDYAHIGGIRDFNNTVYNLENNKDILIEDEFA